MDILRTPDARFANLPDYSFEPHYLEVPSGEGEQLRVHFIDEGPRDAKPVLLMHGEPSWCFLYRKVIPLLVAKGHRVVAPDLVGFGRSDKPTAFGDYTYARHVAWMAGVLFDQLDLRGITFFGQDWGGLIGLRLVARDPERFDRVVVGNTGLPTADRPLGEAFLAWREYSQTVPDFDAGRIVNGGSLNRLTEEEVAAYNAPYHDVAALAGARIFPTLVPASTDDPGHVDNVAAWEVLSRFERPFLTAFSDQDPVTAGADRAFKKLVPGAQGQAHTTITDAGHFLQENAPEQLAEVINGFIEATA